MEIYREPAWNNSRDCTARSVYIHLTRDCTARSVYNPPALGGPGPAGRARWPRGGGRSARPALASSRGAWPWRGEVAVTPPTQPRQGGRTWGNFHQIPRSLNGCGVGIFIASSPVPGLEGEVGVDEVDDEHDAPLRPLVPDLRPCDAVEMLRAALP
jgi:hypothetical protein